MPTAFTIGRVPSYPTNAQQWTVFTNWLLNVVQNIIGSIDTGNGATTAAAAAQATANNATTIGNNAQTSANAAGTAAGNAQASANAAQATANTALTDATTALSDITTINEQIATINAKLAPGLSVTVLLAKLTSGGANGSLTFTGGILTGATDPT